MEPNEFEDYKIQMDAKLADITAKFDELTKASDEKDKEIGKLQAYIANYVSSPTKNEGNGLIETPKSFDDLYNETILEMKQKAMK